MKYFKWTDEYEQLVLRLHSEGLTRSEIAQELTRQCSRHFTSAQIGGKLQELRKKGVRIQDHQPKKKKRGLEPNPKVKGLDVLEEEVHQLLIKKGNLSLGEISRLIDRSKETVVKILDGLRDQGFEVELNDATKKATIHRQAKPEWEKVSVEPYFRSNSVKIGLLSCTHIGSKKQQINLIDMAYDIFEEEGVNMVAHCGDLLDGMNVYRGHRFEVWSDSADDQINYTVDNWPKKRFKTYIVMGNHDESFLKHAGFDATAALCQQREDFVYLGQYAGTFNVDRLGLKFMVMHGGGGMPYAKSYKPQKITEGIMGEVINRARTDPKQFSEIAPDAIFMGHWHNFCYLSHLGTDIVSVPTLQLQTNLLKRNGWQPDIEVMTIEFTVDDEMILRKRWKRYDLSPYADLSKGI